MKLENICAIGMDIGGTKIAAGVVSFPEATVHLKRVIPTRRRRPGRSILDDCTNLARQLLQDAIQSGYEPRGLGVGVPELIDLEGRVNSTHSLEWRDLPVCDAFSPILPAVVESDVRAGALAEALFGAGRGAGTFVYLTIGTGISHTLVIDGHPFPGARGNALICATAPLSTICSRCGERLEPILDYFAAGPALVERYNATSGRSVQHATDVLQAAAEGDPLAGEIVVSAGEAVGNTIGFLINVLDPEMIVVGGGLGLAGGLYWRTLVTSTRDHIWAENSRDLPIVPANLGIDAGLIGAAAASLPTYNQRRIDVGVRRLSGSTG